MKAVIQRVDRVKVTLQNREFSSIERGILLLLGIARGDTKRDAEYLLDKCIHLRIFDDESHKMNKSLLDVNGSLMVVSQFTLLADCVKGRRPSFSEAEEPKRALELYQYFVRKAQERVSSLATGQFQEMMKLEILNDGPVTIILESRGKP